LFAQNPAEIFEKAPPHIDEALRARVSKFYQLQAEKKFRQADALVAEDSKDVFFAADKLYFRGFEIGKITYSENFTKATVMVVLDTDFPSVRVQLQVKMPHTSLWKVIDNEWYWYVIPNPDGSKLTPFGIMHRGPESTTRAALPRIPTPEEILSQVRADKSELRLSSYQPATDEVIVTNAMPGSIRISVEYDQMPGLEIKPDRAEVKAGESVRIVFDYKPPTRAPKPTATARIRVDPTNQVFPVKIEFAIPPEVEKQIRQAR
jgi:hypothetical protein